MLSIVSTPMAAVSEEAASRESAESRIQHPFGVLNPGCSTVSNITVMMANWRISSASYVFRDKNSKGGFRTTERRLEGKHSNQRTTDASECPIYQFCLKLSRFEVIIFLTDSKKCVLYKYWQVLECTI